MSRTSIVYDSSGGVTSITIDGRSIDEHIGRPVALCLHNNNQEIAKAVVDTRNLLNDFSEAVTLAFSEHPGDRALKEYYERIVNITGFFLLRLGDFSAAQQVFEHMLATLRKFESHGSAILHKGVAFHNIAVSQFLQQDFDQAVPNFLRASAEDARGGIQANQSFALKVLQDRYMQPLIDSMKISQLSIFQIWGRPQGNDIKDLLKQMQPESYLFLLQVWKSLEINKPRDNLYSRCRAFDNAKSLALIVETFLGQCCIVTRNVHVSNSYGALHRPTLKDLLKCLFENRAAWFANLDAEWRNWIQFDRNNLPADVDVKLSALLNTPLTQNNPHDGLIRGILLLGLVRNFTAHEFNPYCALTDQVHEDVISRMLAVLLALFDDLTIAGII
jgi:hypothetical protein